MTNPIPFYDFGGDGPLLHFSHSNGYPPAVFRQLIEPLLPHYRVIGVCHRPLWPGSQPEELDSWHTVTMDTIHFFEQQGLEGVIGVGHSLGAVTTMLAAVERPSLFRALVLIEPVFLPPDTLEIIAANPEAMADFPLVRNTRRRRYHWPDRQSAFDHFRGKDVFKYWSDEALWDYVNHGMHEDETGAIVLTYSREWEARFYSRPPLNVWQALPRVTQPTLAIRGAESDTIFSEAWQLWQEVQPGATFVEIPAAGHMVPVERPLLVAQIVLNFLSEGI